MTILRDVNGATTATGTALTLAGKSHKQLQKEIVVLAEKLWQAEKAVRDSQERMRQKSTDVNCLLISLRRKLRDRDETILRMRVERDRLMRDVASSLLLVEGKLRREQKEILQELSSKDRVIEEQKREIRALRNRLSEISVRGRSAPRSSSTKALCRPYLPAATSRHASSDVLEDYAAIPPETGSKCIAVYDNTACEENSLTTENTCIPCGENETTEALPVQADSNVEPMPAPVKEFTSPARKDFRTGNLSSVVEELHWCGEREGNVDLSPSDAYSLPLPWSTPSPIQDNHSLPPDLVADRNDTSVPPEADEHHSYSLPPVVIPVRRWHSASCAPSAKTVPVKRQSSVSFTSDGHVQPLAGSSSQREPVQPPSLVGLKQSSVSGSYVTSFETPVPDSHREIRDLSLGTKISIKVPPARIRRTVSLNSDGDEESRLDSLSSNASHCWTAEDETKNDVDEETRTGNQGISDEVAAPDSGRNVPQKCVRYFGNHRSVIKPRDIKYKRVIRLQGRTSVESQEKLRYWTEPFL